MYGGSGCRRTAICHQWHALLPQMPRLEQSAADLFVHQESNHGGREGAQQLEAEATVQSPPDIAACLMDHDHCRVVDPQRLLPGCCTGLDMVHQDELSRAGDG